MKLTLIAAVALSLGAIGACAKEGPGPDVRAGTTTITSQQEQGPQGDPAAPNAVQNAVGAQGAAGNYATSSGAQQTRSAVTESPRAAAAPPAPRPGRDHVNTPRYVPMPRPSTTGDPPPPPLRSQ
jgi:hypothetical protein